MRYVSFSVIVQRVDFMLENDGSLNVEESVDAVQNREFAQCVTLDMDQYPTTNVEYTIFDALVESEKIEYLQLSPPLNDEHIITTIPELLNRSKGHVKNICLCEMSMASETQANRLFNELVGLDLECFVLCALERRILLCLHASLSSISFGKLGHSSFSDLKFRNKSMRYQLIHFSRSAMLLVTHLRSRIFFL